MCWNAKWFTEDLQLVHKWKYVLELAYVPTDSKIYWCNRLRSREKGPLEYLVGQAQCSAEEAEKIEKEVKKIDDGVKTFQTSIVFIPS